MFLGLNDVAFLGSLQPPTPLLLDAYPNAAAAYSLRQLRTGVTSVVRVRRSSDNTEADFTAAQISDGSLVAWVGAGNNGFVRTWYDQSGANQHAAQTTNGEQPQIVSSGALITDSGRPVISLNGSSHNFSCSSFSVNGFVFFAARPESGGVTFQGLTSSLVVSNSGSTLWALRKTGDPSVAIDGVSSYFQKSVATFKTLRNNCELFINGVSEGTDNTTNEYGSSDTQIFIRDSNRFKGLAHELIIYNSDQSANRTAIESNINTHYAIY
jgi:hypothetical protein